MRLAVILLAALVPIAFAVGRATDDPVARPSSPYTLDVADVVRAPAAATRCEATSEAGIPYLLCTRTPRGRFEVAFHPGAFYVYRNGDPDNPRVYRWEP